MMSRKLAAVVLLLLTAATAGAAPLDSEVRQLVVSIAPDWNSTTGRLQRFDRAPGGWKPVGSVIPVLYGRSGLAWGRGVAGGDEPGAKKVERDGRAPAGIFRIGKIYTYDSSLPKGADYPFHQVTTADAWVDDPGLPEYNRHVRIDPA